MDYKVISGVEHYLNSVNAVKKNQHAKLLDENAFKNIKNATIKKGTGNEKSIKSK